MRLNKAGELFLVAQDSNVNERSSWHESLIERSCFHTSASITKIPPQFHSKFTTWDWPKKLEDDSIAHYKSYTSRAELASVLDNEKKFFDRRPGPVKPPRKSRSSKVLNINENPNLNISCVPSNLEKYPHDKLSWVINHNMTTGDPYEKSFYEKPKLEVPSQQSNFNFQYQVNTLTDNFVKHVSLNESPKKSINRNELVRDLVKNNESTHKQSNRNESIRGLVKKNEFTHNLIQRNELAQDSVRDNESVKTPINRNESLKDLVKRNELVQNLMNRNESTQDLLNMNRSNFMTDETTPERVSAASAGKRQDTDTRVDNEPKALGFPDANRFSEKDRSADCRVDSYRAYLAKKQEKTDINNSVKLGASANQNRYCSEKKDAAPKTRPDAASRRAARKKKCSESLSGFDVYNIETALPQIDLDAIENHLKAAREEERRRRNDREEIRRRLATGDADDFSTNERPGKKPSLQSRLQSGMNLQICFMNETMSDTESPSSDQDSPAKTASSKTSNSESSESPPKLTAAKPVRPLFNNKTQPVPQDTIQTEQDFFAQQAKLQADARQALAEAKETARRQMEIERQRMTTSPITDMLRASLTKVGVPFPEERRRLSRQLLTNMNVAQLQVIVNDLHTQIEILNEDLVKFLMERDELHMGQDSMLVDIEDLTRYLGAKEKSQKGDLWTNNNSDFVKSLTPVPAKPKQTRISPLSMMKK